MDAIIRSGSFDGNDGDIASAVVPGTAGRVAVRGVYVITAKDGETAEARFAHFWTVADGRLTRMDHVGESSVFQRLRQD